MLKRAIIDRLVDERFVPQVFFEAGLPQALSWSFDKESAGRLLSRRSILLRATRS